MGVVGVYWMDLKIWTLMDEIPYKFGQPSSLSFKSTMNTLLILISKNFSHTFI